MGILLDLFLIIVKIFGVWLAVSVIFSVIGLTIYDLIQARHFEKKEQCREEFFEDIEDYLIKQAEYEMFFNQIEEYRNDFA